MYKELLDTFMNELIPESPCLTEGGWHGPDH